MKYILSQNLNVAVHFNNFYISIDKKKIRYNYIGNIVGSKQIITNFKLFWTMTCRTSNSLKPRFIHQNWTSNPLEPIKKTKLRTCSARNRMNRGPSPKSGKTELQTSALVVFLPCPKSQGQVRGPNSHIPWNSTLRSALPVFSPDGRPCIYFYIQS